ncbi:MAG: hypothetical protein IT452_22615 [Planctomycetia bacterium]|nr:hypothetical protein [Planctomycetia bacterium]
MGLIDLIPDLESTDPETRFKAVTALYKMGAAAAPAVPKLVPLLRDLDGVNVQMTDGSERMIPIAERAAMALGAIGEPAAGGVVAELRADNAVSAIHCIRVLATPLLAKRAPVNVIGERLMRPKVSPAMATALCEVLSQILKSGDEASKTTAKMALMAGVAAGKVPAKFQGLVSKAPAVREIPVPAPAPPKPPPAPEPAPAAASGGWVSSEARISEMPQPRPAEPPPPAEPAPAAEVRRPSRPPSTPSIDRPTSMSPSVTTPEPEAPVENLRGRTVERPAPPKFERTEPVPPPPAEMVREMQQRVPPFAPAPDASAASYEEGDQFAYRQEVGDLLKRGDKLKAVNLLRQKTGASLVEALKQVETWS